jgi:hypothetical protein
MLASSVTLVEQLQQLTWIVMHQYALSTRKSHEVIMHDRAQFCRRYLPPFAGMKRRKSRLLGKMRSASVLLMLVAVQAHFSARAQASPPPPPPPACGQHPTLLTSYAKRPPWKVAGVDYPVGVPSTATLTDWQSLQGPGITVNATAMPPYVRVDDTSNVVISGVDFSLHGGAILLFVNSPNSTVASSNFGGKNLTKILNSVIWADPNSPGLTVRYSTIDGAGSGSGATLVSVRSAGTTTLEYNWFKNFPEHVLEEAQSAPVSIAVIYKYNLIEQGGMARGAHLNYLQFGGAVATSVDVEYNTTYQTPQVASGEGFQFYANNTGGAVNKVTFAYNTMIATGGPRIAMSYLVHGGGSQNAGVAHDNYFDTTAAYGAFYPGSFTGWTFSNNYSMTTGGRLIP